MLDLYNVPDPQRYLNPLEARIEEGEASEPLVDYYKSRPAHAGNNMFNLNNDEDDGEEEDEEDLVDDSEEETGRKSV